MESRAFKDVFPNDGNKGRSESQMDVGGLILGHVNAKRGQGTYNESRHALAFWKCALQPCMGPIQRGLSSRNKMPILLATCTDPDRESDEGVYNACERTQLKSHKVKPITVIRESLSERDSSPCEHSQIMKSGQNLVGDSGM